MGYQNKWFLLALLTLIYALNVVDRYLLGILLPNIKADLDLPDSALGLLSGVAFAIFYATLGVPIARLADRTSRKTVIIASLAIFSGMTALCGMAQNFLSLFLARVGVGIGEAGSGPASYSIIADLFEKTKRSTAMAIYGIGSNIGLLAGFAAGGYLAAHYDWRIAFFAVGAPGLLLALFSSFALREPSRGMADAIRVNTTQKTGFTQALSFLWKQAAFRHLIFGTTLVQFLNTGVVAWLPSMLARSHDMPIDAVGVKLGLAFGIAGSIGTLILGGVVADALSKRDLRWATWILAAGEFLVAPAYVAVLLAPNGDLAVLAFLAPATLATFFLGPVLSLTQALAPINMRATAGAFLLLVINLVGLGLGPVAIGVISDYLAPTHGVDSLRIALWLAPIAAIWACVHYALAARTLLNDIARAETKNAE